MIDRRGLNGNNLRRLVDSAVFTLPFDLGSENDRLQGVEKRVVMGVDYLVGTLEANAYPLSGVTFVNKDFNYKVIIKLQDVVGNTIKELDTGDTTITKGLRELPNLRSNVPNNTKLNVILNVVNLDDSVTTIPDSDLDIVFKLGSEVINFDRSEGNYLG